MTTILVCSDSHGKRDRINRLASDVHYDYLFFLGDGLSDVDGLDLLDDVKCVKGNCDYFSTESCDRIIEIEGKRLLLTHGNNYGVKFGLGALAKYAKTNNIDIVLYGHTHKFAEDNIDGVRLYNPGSVKNGSAALLSINGDKIDFRGIIAD